MRHRAQGVHLERPVVGAREEGPPLGPEQLLWRRVRFAEHHEPLGEVPARGGAADGARRKPRLERRSHPEVHHGLRGPREDLAQDAGVEVPRMEVLRGQLRVPVPGSRPFLWREVHPQGADHGRRGHEVSAYGYARKAEVHQLRQVRHGVGGRQAGHAPGHQPAGAHYGTGLHQVRPAGQHDRLYRPCGGAAHQRRILEQGLRPDDTEVQVLP
mmetsp:Transcript_19120/g.57146  ORF Transcript_19120/g.57146 Transcript_19120/m.57146 type:complete len:213 (+) Transcript_19120:146-784(+)